MPSLANGYERVAQEFLARRGNPATAARGIGVAQVRPWARALPRGATVLDIGCGPGMPITKALVDEGLTVFGVDASPTFVSAFRKYFPGVPIACESIEESTFFGRTFDAIVMWGVWFLLPESTQRALPQRLAVALRDGGRLLFTAPPVACTWLDAMTGEESRSLGADVYRGLLGDAGLAVLAEYEDVGENHYYDAVKRAANSSPATR